MRYISLFTHEPRTSPPTQDEMATMGKLIDEGLKKGWLIVELTRFDGRFRYAAALFAECISSNSTGLV